MVLRWGRDLTEMGNDSTTTEELWELLGERLKNFILSRVPDEQVAEDLLQETFIRVHTKLDDMDDIQRISSWVYQIARNLIIDHYRSKAKEAETIVNDLEADSDEDQNINELVSSWLPYMISQLPDSYREAVELYELKGLPQQEIANHLDLSLSGAKSRVQRGRDKLKSLLFDCCSFEKDPRGNVIGFKRNNPTKGCGGECDC
jgi:RNA polymerase sigma-70 factor, ECF subfamily